MSSPSSESQPTFEESLKRLEEIVSVLESGKSDLETSLARYEEGIKLLRLCHRTLENAEQRIEVLKKISASGEWETEEIAETEFRSDESTAGRQNAASVFISEKSSNSSSSSPNDEKTVPPAKRTVSRPRKKAVPAASEEQELSVSSLANSAEPASSADSAASNFPSADTPTSEPSQGNGFSGNLFF